MLFDIMGAFICSWTLLYIRIPYVFSVTSYICLPLLACSFLCDAVVAYLDDIRLALCTKQLIFNINMTVSHLHLFAIGLIADTVCLVTSTKAIK